MNRVCHKIFCIVLLFLFAEFASAQYVMQNALVTDCEGTLTDSDEGPNSGQYDHEEDFLFTICVEGASEITILFDFFATEASYDILTVYDGPDTNAPIIAVLEGVLTNPPVLIANSGCISFHFVSDDNIVAEGWSLSWFVEVDDIADPNLIVESALDCPLGDLELSIDPSVPCEVLVPENFQLIGPGSSTISDVTVIDCDSDGKSSSFNLMFSDSLNLVGDYLIVFSSFIVNSCGDTLHFESNVGFELNNCPFQVEIIEVESACAGACGLVEVEIHSMDSGPFLITWSHTTDSSETVNVCADSIFLIEVLVENLANGQSAEDQFVYMAIPLPQILNPFMSDTLCSSQGIHSYSVDVVDGLWNSKIMDDTDDVRYNLGKWNNSNGIQQDIITYTDPNGCIAMDTVYISPVSAGPYQAVCIGQNEITLYGNNPNDGIWSGPFTTPEGVFTVSVLGEFAITFTSPDGCTSEKLVDVVDEIEILNIDTLCSNADIKLRNYVNAYGGIWTGPGITNGRNGRLMAWKANINEWNTYYYDIEGCRDSMDIYVQGIWAGDDRSVCSLIDIIQLRVDGDWTGAGIYNPIDSTYDISGLAPGTYDLILRKANCQDKMELTISDVALDYIGEEIYCYDEGLIPIGDIVSQMPNSGNYSGSAVVNISDEIFLDPSLVIGTESKVFFEALGCMDSVLVQIEQPVNLYDYEFCEFDDLQTLDNNGNEGYWEGPGVLIPDSGLINVSDLKIGYNEVYFVTKLGCRTRVVIDVVAFEEAEINNVEESYCYQDSNYLLNLVPPGGVFTVNGIASTAAINPANLGSGFHELKYVVGKGNCEDKTTTYIVVSEAISGFTYASYDTLCPQESTSIFAESSGGYGVITGYWDQGLGFGKSHIVFPNATTQYTVTLTDGCSDDLELDLEVVVIDPFKVDFEFGPPVCFGDSSYIEIYLDQPEDYEISWNSSSNDNDMIYTNLPGEYQLNIVEKATGCEQDFWLEVPGAAFINADFSLIPNQDTIDILNNDISVVNLAQGYTSGYMNFDQGDPDVDLDFGDLFTYYNEIGEYTITQVVSNELGCIDSVSKKLYVDNLLRIYVPNIFSPNGDDINDLFTIGTLGNDSFEVSIFNRWGNLLFKSTDVNNAWDGTFKGSPVVPGVYSVMVKYSDQKTGTVYQEAFSLTLVR